MLFSHCVTRVKEIAKLYEDIVEDKTARTSIACTATAFGDELIDTLSVMFGKSSLDTHANYQYGVGRNLGVPDLCVC